MLPHARRAASASSGAQLKRRLIRRLDIGSHLGAKLLRNRHSPQLPLFVLPDADAGFNAAQPQLARLRALNRESESDGARADMLNPAAANALVARPARRSKVRANARYGKADAVLADLNEAHTHDLSEEVFHQFIENDVVLRVINDARRIAMAEMNANGLFVDKMLKHELDEMTAVEKNERPSKRRLTEIRAQPAQDSLLRLKAQEGAR